MTEPKWVLAFGTCASCGGFYDNYTTRRRASTKSSPATSTSPAARRAPKPCSTGSCSCRTRSRAATARPAIVKPRDDPREHRPRASSSSRRKPRSDDRHEQNASSTRSRQQFGAAILETHAQLRRRHRGRRRRRAGTRSRASCATIRACDMNMFVDLCGVDYPERASPRFEVVLHLYSISKRHRVRLKARVGDDDGDGAEIDIARRRLAGRQLVRARDVRHDGHRLPRPPGSAPHPACTPSSSGTRSARTTRPTRRSRSSPYRTRRSGLRSRSSPPFERRRGHASFGAPQDVVTVPSERRPEATDGTASITSSKRASSSCPSEPMHLNMGPSHPAMHGTVRIVLELSGETIVKSRRADRLSAPRLREDVRARHLDAGLPVRRPAATTSRRCSTTWASRSRSRSCSASRCPSAASTTA